MIRYIIPWSSDKNLSGLYNREIMALPNDNDWVCFCDRDTYFPDPFYGVHIEQTIKANPDYSLFTCMTNRVGTAWQCVKDKWTVEKPKAHEDIAKRLWYNNGTEVVNISDRSPISGMFILVQKRFITENRPLKDGLLLGGDNDFSYIANEGLENVGLMTGIYIWHYYRNGILNDKSHLLP